MRMTGHEDPALRYLGHLVLIAWPGVCLLAGLGARRLVMDPRGTGIAAALAGAAALAWWTPAGRILAEAITGAKDAWTGAHLAHMRADTAAATALAVVQSAWGDWR